MNTTITKKQVFGLATAAMHVRAVATLFEDEDCYPDFDPDIFYDTGTYLLVQTLELMPEDKEFDSFRNIINKQLNK